MDNEGLTTCSLDCTEVEQAMTKFESLLRATETIETQLCAKREENAAIEEKIREKTKESTKLRDLFEVALARKHERLQILRRISQLRKSRKDISETPELASHSTQQEIISLQSQYNSLMEQRNTKQMLLKAARETHAEEFRRLQEVLKCCKKERDDRFAYTVNAQEAVVAAREERDKLLQELQYTLHRFSEKNKENDLKETRGRRQTYNSLLEKIKQAEQRKQNLLQISRTDTTRVIQLPSTKRALPPLALRCGRRVLSELIEDAGKTASLPSVNYQHLDI